MSRRKQVIFLTVLGGLALFAAINIALGEGGLYWWSNLLLPLLAAALFVREWRRESQ